MTKQQERQQHAMEVFIHANNLLNQVTAPGNRKNGITLTGFYPYPYICRFYRDVATLDSPILGQWRVAMHKDQINGQCSRIAGEMCKVYPNLQYDKVLPIDGQPHSTGDLGCSQVNWYIQQVDEVNQLHTLLLLGGPNMDEWRVLQHSWVAPRYAFLMALGLTREQREQCTEAELLEECRSLAMDHMNKVGKSLI